MRHIFACDDWNWTTSRRGEVRCDNWVEVDITSLTGPSTAEDFAQFAELIGITPENILYVFTWGMGAVLSVWAIGYAIGVAAQTIRRA
jgi:hypothetical protein